VSRHAAPRHAIGVSRVASRRAAPHRTAPLSPAFIQSFTPAKKSRRAADVGPRCGFVRTEWELQVIPLRHKPRHDNVNPQSADWH